MLTNRAKDSFVNVYKVYNTVTKKTGRQVQKLNKETICSSLTCC